MMIFCLGIFIFPKQNFISTSEMSDCCKTEKNCCGKSEKKSCHSKKNDKKSCEGNCANCHSCCSTVVINLDNKTIFENIFNQTSQTAEQEVAMNQLEDRDKQFLNQLHAIIQKNLSDSEFGVEDIGKGIGLSRVQLYRKVKAMTGSSVVDLLRKARLAKAKRLLESRSMSVSEVAYDVGFSAPSYFTKCFKEEYGMLPGEVGNK